jgi:hypothetical protein
MDSPIEGFIIVFSIIFLLAVIGLIIVIKGTKSLGLEGYMQENYSSGKKKYIEIDDEGFS